MAVLKICKWGHPALKNRAKEIRTISAELRQLALDMFDTMLAYGGVGLAANQVGVLERMFVVEIPVKNEKSLQYVFINPEITYSSKRRVTQEEGCLSFPEINAPVERAEEVEIQGTDLNGEPINLRVSGLFARAVQHELDHLDGMVFIERMNIIHRLGMKKQLTSLAKHTREELNNPEKKRRLKDKACSHD